MKEYLSIAIKDTFFIWREELKNIFRDSGVIIFFLIVPLAYPVLYALIYNPETAREVTMVVVDHSGTAASREFVRRIDATPDVKVAAFCRDMEEARMQMDRKEGYGILYIPASFSEDIHSGKQTTVSLFCDMGALLYYKALLLATTEVSLDMGKDIRLRNMEGSTIRMDEINGEPVSYEAISLYNTQNGFSSFLLPAILILVIQQTLLLGVGMLAGTARERNRFGNLIPMSKQYIGVLRIVLGKALAYLIIYIVVSAWALLVVPALFSLPRIGSFGLIVLFTLPFLFSSIFLAMSLSCLVSGRETPMMVFVFTSVPLLFLTGISWPQSAMPDFWRFVAYFFPSSHGVQAFVKVNTMGASLSQIAFEYRALWLLTGSYFVITCLLYRYQIIRARRGVHLIHGLLKKRRKEPTVE